MIRLLPVDNLGSLFSSGGGAVERLNCASALPPVPGSPTSTGGGTSGKPFKPVDVLDRIITAGDVLRGELLKPDGLFF